MYTFKVNINKKEYDDYAANYNLISVMQESAWACVKDNWRNVLVGLYKDNVMVAAASLLIRKLALNFNLIYVPRGYLIDYTNEELVKTFTNYLKNYAKEQKAYCIKIDPFFCINETSFKENREIPLNFKLDYDKKHQNLIHSGYIHKGFKKDLSSYLQPRYHMAVPLIDKNNNFLDSDTIRTSISRTTRNYIGNYHQKRGVYFTYSSNISNLDNFYDIINMTEQRQHITLRNKDYFKKILTSFKERALLCFAHVDLDKYMSFLDSEIKANNKNNDLKRQYEEANELHQKYGTDVITSVALVLMPSNKGVRMMEYLYAGNNTSILSHLNTNVGLLFDIFKKCLEKNIHYCNLGGVEGTLDDNLTTFKSKFNPVILEFAGEYDLPINKGTYKVINGLIPYAKKTYKKIRSLIRKVK